jgi:nucleoside-diphosphate-sugar epimerase
MRVLFIGGTGIISTACTQLAAQLGIDLTVATRGRRPVELPGGITTLKLDMDDPASARQALSGQQFDSVVDWIAFTPAQVARDIELFRGRTRQYVFISSASAYRRPPGDHLITESTPLGNPFWQYSRDKIACEDLLIAAWRNQGFPATIVRPSLTYGRTQIPLALNVWTKSYTVIDRMRRGKKVIVPGDGSSLWVITHNSDFAKGLVGLLGNPQAVGEAFHITSDEVHTWDQFFQMAADAAGVEPRIVHISSDFLGACVPDWRGGLLGDKSVSVVFDNSKIKRFVPGFQATVPFREGIRETLAWFDADPARQEVDEEANLKYDKLIDLYERGLEAAVKAFSG